MLAGVPRPAAPQRTHARTHARTPAGKPTKLTCAVHDAIILRVGYHQRHQVGASQALGVHRKKGGALFLVVRAQEALQVAQAG